MTIRTSSILLCGAGSLFVSQVIFTAVNGRGEAASASLRVLEQARPQAGAAPAPFPRTPAHLQDLLRRQQSADLDVRTAAVFQARAEAWSLLSAFGGMERSTVNSAAVVTHGPLPAWEAWKNKCDLRLSRLCNQELTLAKQNTSAAKPRFSVVRYNRAAADWIDAREFADSKTLRTLLIAGLHDISPAFPRSSVVVKEIWQSFNTNADSSKATIPIYDPQLVPDSGTLPDLPRWTNTIKIKRLSNGAVDFRAGCRPGSYTGSQRKSVPVNCFVHHVATRHCSDLVKYTPNVKPMQGAAAFPNPPCVTILVGFHIMTREMDNWTWNTFWWSNIVYGDTYRDDRPSNLPQAFTHMAMNTMLSSASGRSVPEKIFNPYLEGPQGTGTSCLQCHANAAYIPASNVPNPPRDGIANPQDNTSENVNFCTKPVTNPATNHCRIRTAFLWSLATNQDKDSNEAPFNKHSVGLPLTRKMMPRE